MDIKDIKDLAELMKTVGLTAIEVKEDEHRYVRLERKPDVASVVPAAVQADFLRAEPETRIPAGFPAAETPNSLEIAGNKDGTLVTAPTVGIFYVAPSPESDPYVQLGDEVKKGDTLCIIEAMKLMNEIAGEADGKIAEIYVGNGQVVEYGQPLFRIV